MKNSTLLTKFNSARKALEQDRSKVAAKLAEYDAALASIATSNGHIRSTEHHNARTRTKVSNKLSLKSLVAEIVRRKPLDKQEILEQVLARGYKFTTDKPMGSLNAMLYSESGKAQFRNHGGKFSAK